MRGVSFPPTMLIPSSTYGFARWTSMAVISPSGREGSFTQPSGHTSDITQLHFRKQFPHLPKMLDGCDYPFFRLRLQPVRTISVSLSELSLRRSSVRGTNDVIPSSADRGGDSGQSQPEEVELTERRRWIQGLLRGRFTLGTTHSNPTTPTDTGTWRDGW